MNSSRVPHPTRRTRMSCVFAKPLSSRNRTWSSSWGGGSSIDAAKAAVAYHALRDVRSDLMDYFGVGQVSAMLEASGRRLLPIVAVQLAGKLRRAPDKVLQYYVPGPRPKIVDR